MKDTSAPCAITWRWIHEAGGLLTTSPAWRQPPTKSQRVAYRQFASAVLAHRWSLEDAVARQADVTGAVVQKAMETLAVSARVDGGAQDTQESGARSGIK